MTQEFVVTAFLPYCDVTTSFEISSIQVLFFMAAYYYPCGSPIYPYSGVTRGRMHTTVHFFFETSKDLKGPEEKPRKQEDYN